LGGEPVARFYYCGFGNGATGGGDGVKLNGVGTLRLKKEWHML